MVHKTAACGLHCLKLKDITVRTGDTTLIENINLHIHCGKLTAIIGRNGAGKSTLIKAILGEIKYEGKVEFRTISKDILTDLTVGYVPQHINIADGTPTSVYDLFASYISNIPVFLHKSKRLKENIMNRLSLFGASELVDKKVGELSGGELQRVLLSIACTPVPNLLLLDEPVSGIDINGMDLFYKNLAMLRENYDLAMILVSHDFEYIAKYADSVIMMDKTVLMEGTPEEVFSSDKFAAEFGTNVLGA